MKRKIFFAFFNITLCLSMLGLPNSGKISAQFDTTNQINSACGSDPTQVGCWQMEEGSGTQILDGTGNGNNGTLTGSPTWVPGHTGLALNLNGSSQYAIVTDNASLDITNNITLSAWIKPSKVGTQGVIKKTLGSAAGNGYELSLATTGYVFTRFGGAANRLDSVTPYPTDGNTWMHIAATYDGTNIRMYINGIENSSRPYSLPIVANTTNLGIGVDPTPQNYYQGVLDDLRIYNRPLSAAEIYLLYSNNIGGCVDLTSQASTASTGEKPMSKVWSYAGKWWSVFPISTGTWIWRLDGKSWTPIRSLTASTSVKADVKPSGDPIGSVVHILLYYGTSADLASVQYNSTSGGGI
jgi:hypothetical protein